MTEKTLTREELYELVWSTPMRTLAPQLHLSDVGLAKLCRRHAIPLPERGFWAKKEHGKAVTQPALPPVTDGRLNTIRLYIPEGSTQEIAAEDDPEVVAWTEREHEQEHRIAVSEEIRSYHPLTSATKRWFEQQRKTFEYPAKPEQIDHLHTVNVTKDAERRVLRLYDALLRACEKRGWTVRTVTRDRDTTTTFHVLAEAVRVFIEERLERKPHELTAKEQKAVAERRAYRIPKYDYFGTGVLKVTIDEYGAKQTFVDRTDRPLEAQLNDVMIALVRTAVLTVRPRRLEAEQERQRMEEQQRRAAIEQRRRTQFGELLQHWSRHQQERAVLADVDAALAADPDLAAHPEVSAWRGWARQHLTRTDPVRLYLRALASGKALQTYCYPPIWSAD